MLIVGAKGFAKEILQIIYLNEDSDNLCFFDDLNINCPDYLFNKYKILKTEEEVINYFTYTDARFTIGIGNPKLRVKMYEKFKNLGGKFVSTISKNAELGTFGVRIENGCNILSGVKISNDVEIGEGTMIYYNSIITHDVKVGRFVEISPDVKLLGRSLIGDFSHIGTGAIIFPDTLIGKHSIVAAGSVVRNNVPDYTLVAGVPAIQKKKL